MAESYTGNAYKKYVYTHKDWQKEARDYEDRLALTASVSTYSKKVVKDALDKLMANAADDLPEEEQEVMNEPVEEEDDSLATNMEKLQVAFSERENAGSFKKSWRKFWGGVRSLFRGKSMTGSGMLRTGTAGDTVEFMLNNYKKLGASQDDLLDMRLALIGWLCLDRKNSLYEVLSASRSAGVKGTEDMTEAATMYIDIDPLHTEDLRGTVAKDGQFPHEIIYKEILDDITKKREEWAKGKKYDRDTETWRKDPRYLEEDEEKPVEEQKEEYIKVDEIMKDFKKGEKSLSENLKEPEMEEVPELEMRPLDDAFKKELYPMAAAISGGRSGNFKEDIKKQRDEIPKAMMDYMESMPMIMSNAKMAQKLLEEIEEGVIFGGKSYEEMSEQVKRINTIQKILDIMGKSKGVEMKRYVDLVSKERLDSLKEQSSNQTDSVEPDEKAFEQARQQYYAKEIEEWKKRKADAELKYQKEMAEFTKGKQLRGNLSDEDAVSLMEANRNKATKKGGKKTQYALYDFDKKDTTQAKNEKAGDIALNMYSSTAYRRMVNIMQFGIFGRYKTLEPQREKDKETGKLKIKRAAYIGDYVDRAMGGDAIEQASHAIRISARIALDTLREGGPGTKNKKGEGIFVFRGENVRDGSYSVGATYTTKKITSTAKAFDQAYAYYNSVDRDQGADVANLSVMKLTGESGMSLDEVSINNAEKLQEVTLPYGVKFRVVKERTKYVKSDDVRSAEQAESLAAFQSLKGDAEDAKKKIKEWKGDADVSESKKSGRLHISVSEEVPDSSARANKVRELNEGTSEAAKRHREMLKSLLVARKKLEEFTSYR